MITPFVIVAQTLVGPATLDVLQPVWKPIEMGAVAV